MDKVIKNKRGLELVTSPSSGYKTSSKNVTLWNDRIKVTNSQVHDMVLQCSKLFHSILSSGFLSQDSHISYSFGKIQNQAFINYNFFIYKILGMQNCFRWRPFMWEIVPIKEQTCMFLTLKWYGCRKCTKLISKPWAATNGLPVSVLCIAPSL